MNFIKNVYHTSDKHDYYATLWDKGHLAPAATYSDSNNNLYDIFVFKCTLQDQYLNRGAVEIIRTKERVWDDTEQIKNYS
jgi:DNA/RNA endonuclease G (NUC1)